MRVSSKLSFLIRSVVNSNAPTHPHIHFTYGSSYTHLSPEKQLPWLRKNFSFRVLFWVRVAASLQQFLGKRAPPPTLFFLPPFHPFPPPPERAWDEEEKTEHHITHRKEANFTLHTISLPPSFNCLAVKSHFSPQSAQQWRERKRIFFVSLWPLDRKREKDRERERDRPHRKHCLSLFAVPHLCSREATFFFATTDAPPLPKYIRANAVSSFSGVDLSFPSSSSSSAFQQQHAHAIYPRGEEGPPPSS